MKGNKFEEYIKLPSNPNFKPASYKNNQKKDKTTIIIYNVFFFFQAIVKKKDTACTAH